MTTILNSMKGKNNTYSKICGFNTTFLKILYTFIAENCEEMKIQLLGVDNDKMVSRMEEIEFLETGNIIVCV